MSSSFDPFESLDSLSNLNRPKKALWAIDLDDKDNEKNIIEWLNGELNFLKDISRERISRIRRNVALFQGIQYQTQELKTDIRDRGVDRSRSFPKIVVNHLYDLTQQRVSRLVKYKPGIQIVPTNDEFEDKVASKLTKALLDNIWENEHFQADITNEAATIGSVMGEVYLFITWNPNKGDKHPDSKEDEKVPLLDDDGSQMTDDQGNKIYIEGPVNVGDVEYEVVMPHDVYLEPKERLKEVNYCYRRRVMQLEEARLKYPKSAGKIKSTEDLEIFDFNTMETRKLVNEVVVWEFYHKKTPAMPKGRWMAFTKDAVLMNDEYPYNHKELPFERWTDLDIPGKLYGVSFFETIKALTSTYNNITNMIQRNQFLVSHPKYMVPAGSVDIKHLANDITIVQYKGQVPPQLVQMNPTPSEVFNYRDQLKNEFQQIAGVFNVSRGETPPGVKSGVAIQFLHEQESERFNQAVLKWNEWIRRVAIKTLAVAGDYYDTSDKRMVRIVGKNNAWTTKLFEVTNLSKPYDIRVQNSSALPESKAARIEYITELNREFPNMIPQEQVVEMLDLGQTEKFINNSTAAVQAAEAENELILNGESTSGPQEYEDHYQHWKIHSRAIQSVAFKEMTPKKIQKQMLDHIMVHEMWISQKMKTNQKLAELISQESMFPIVFVPESNATPELGDDASEQGVPAAPGVLAQTGEVPVNPEVGGEAQALVQDPQVPAIVQDDALLEPPPIEPTNVT